MAVAELTRQQLAELDRIVVPVPEAEVERMNMAEARNYREMLAIREGQEQVFLAETVDTPAPEPPAYETLPEAPPPVAVKPDLTPEPAPEPEFPERKFDENELARWREQAEAYKQRYRDAQAALSPAQQNAASLRKKLGKNEDALEDLRSEFDTKLNAILEAVNKPRHQEPAAFVVQDEFAQTYPDVAQRLAETEARIRRELEAQTEAKIRAIEARAEGIRIQNEQAQMSAHRAQHDAAVLGYHPDIGDLLGNPDKRAPFDGWLLTQPKLMRDVLEDPYSHTPQDIAYVVDQYKRATRTNGTAKKPSLGDLAAKVTNGSVIPQSAPTQAAYLTDKELENFDALLQKAAQQGKADELLARYEQTLMRNAR